MVKVKDLSTKLFEGSYEYFNNGESYCQESFVVFKNEENKTIVYRVEVLSRVKTGELLKVNIDYEVSAKWNPVRVNIIKYLGEDYAEETFLVDYESNSLEYIFSDGKDEQQITRSIPNKFQITTPCFTTSMLYTQSKKSNAMGRNQYTLLVSQSEWAFNPEILDESVYAEFKTHEKTEIKLNNQSLACTKVVVYKHDSVENVQEAPVLFYLSKHAGLPYMMDTESGVSIRVKNLKKIENPYEDFR